jgi:FMN phosphatase YigB (HAD superfamily)
MDGIGMGHQEVEVKRNLDLRQIDCFVFDFGATLSSHPYFTVCPPECPEWADLFQAHVFKKARSVFDDWMAGEIDARDVAEMMSPVTGIAANRVIEFMKLGVRGLSQNKAVRDLAIRAREMGKRMVLVTGNIDLFDTEIVPDLGLSDIFEVIVNSSRSRELHKEKLWDEAFRLLNSGASYETSFLIEDSTNNVEMFRRLGGYAHLYVDDEGLIKEMQTLSW